jgi:hypothetical protein
MTTSPKPKVPIGKPRVRPDALDGVLAADREMVTRTIDQPGCNEYDGQQLVGDPSQAIDRRRRPVGDGAGALARVAL